MKARIDMIGIVTNQLDTMKAFYRDVMGFSIKLELDEYVEFNNDGVRFALSTGAVMEKATGEPGYTATNSSHAFELAFRADTPDGVDEMFAAVTDQGAKVIKDPADMPWGQRTAFFADPDGNIHEIFCDLTIETN